MPILRRPILPPLSSSFVCFHNQNLHVYDLFSELTYQLIQAGYSTYGVNAVAERMRWHTEVETRNREPFKLSNSHRPFYARLWMLRNPAHSGFYVLRPSEADALFINGIPSMIR